MPYVEQDSDENGVVTETRQWADDGTFTQRKGDEKGPIVYQGPVPPGIVKAIGEYNVDVSVVGNEARLGAIRNQLASRGQGGQGGLNLGLNLGTITLLNTQIVEIRDAVIALIDIQRDTFQ